MKDVPEEEGAIEGSSAKIEEPIIDPLSIEQAIMDKTGAETATPAGSFTQVNSVDDAE